MVLIKKTDNPFGIAVQALTFGRMEKYSNMLSRNVFEELEFGRLNSDEVLSLSDGLKNEEDRDYFNTVAYNFYIMSNKLNIDIVIEAAETFWEMACERMIKEETVCLLVQEDIDILAKSAYHVRGYVLPSRDPDLWEKMWKQIDAPRFMKELEARMERGGTVSNIYAFTFGVYMEEGSALHEFLKTKTKEIFDGMYMTNVEV